jgi:hypothetical protein
MRSSTNSIAVSVVPMPRRCGLPSAVSNTAQLALRAASRITDTAGGTTMSISGLVGVLPPQVSPSPAALSRSTTCSRRSCSMALAAATRSPRASATFWYSTWSASFDACSPPWWPPMPSATANRPMSSATKKLSSLWSRFLPVSVLAQASSRIVNGTPRPSPTARRRRSGSACPCRRPWSAG